MEQTLLLEGEQIEGKLIKLADEIAEEIRKTQGVQPALIGIRSRGDVLAKRIMGMLAERNVKNIEHGSLDITLYRDDLATEGGRRPVRITELPSSIEGKLIFLIDDVMHTGRSVRAAMDALVDFGRPKAIRLAVLVDRGGREYPIQPDYVGLRADVPDKNRITVQVAEEDGADRVVVETE
jgi:pyrimidine operon attenuation protein/uracil phosphoribosyltransferase